MFRVTQSLVRPAVLVLLVAAAAGCSSDDEALFGPTPVIPDPTTVVVSGSVTPNGAFTHPFVSQSFGTVTATVVTLGPDPEAVIGVALGTWNGVVCQIILANDQATQGTVVTGNVTSVGSLCLRVFDARGTLPGTATFDIQLVHP